ncbi:MAG TPA: sugar phosphate isomerase/epimerase [Cyclobacteriaceae bacterium]|nr:sugar phosphate isomerase/epimerase [Cyclobacteriaceae bacterium]
MISRRGFLQKAAGLSATALIAPSLAQAEFISPKRIGIQLYTVRKEMLEDATGTLKKIANLGFTDIESARSEKGNYYGLSAKEIKKVCEDLGMMLRSGHVHVDADWNKTLDQASETGQEYLICSSMPEKGQTVDNYKRTAEIFSKRGEECKKHNIKFGYHNHDYEFESENGQVLYDVLLTNTDPTLVHMELDLGWVVAAGKDPLQYFKNFQGRFPLWHLKDMNLTKKESTEFGKGGLNISKMLENKEQSGLKYFFVEQEEYAVSPFDSMKQNLDYLKKLL